MSSSPPCQRTRPAAVASDNDRIVVITRNAPTQRATLETDPAVWCVDVTSKSKDFSVLSPFYPHKECNDGKGFAVRDIVPTAKHDPRLADAYSYSLEAIWQGLKDYKDAGIDTTGFTNDKMKNLKRTMRKHGALYGHWNGREHLSHTQAQQEILIKGYRWMLEHAPAAQRAVHELNSLLDRGYKLVFLDYMTNRTLGKPLSHAQLLCDYLLEQRQFDEEVSSVLMT